MTITSRPQSDFERPGGEPPMESVVWVIVEQRDASNRMTEVAQTAYTAFELSGIKSREGLLLAYSQVTVTHSEPATKAMQVDGMEAGMRHIFSPPTPPKEPRPTKFRRSRSIAHASVEACVAAEQGRRARLRRKSNGGKN